MTHLAFLLSSTLSLDVSYAFTYIACIVGIYFTIVIRAGDELPRKEVDLIFFLTIGVSALFWILANALPPSMH